MTFLELKEGGQKNRLWIIGIGLAPRLVTRRVEAEVTRRDIISDSTCQFRVIRLAPSLVLFVGPISRDLLNQLTHTINSNLTSAVGRIAPPVTPVQLTNAFNEAVATAVEEYRKLELCGITARSRQQRT